MVRVVRKNRFLLATDFACSARRYWLAVFPLVARELYRRRTLATRIPDPLLRCFAIEALSRKRGNVEGAAAFASLVPRSARAAVVRALVSCQVICDYLDLLSEQPCCDPLANGYTLHEALMVATKPREAHRDYYAHHPRGEDGGYLQGLVETAQQALSELPSLASVEPSMGRAAERIAVYQSFNHGDASGSYDPFERWAERATAGYPQLCPWETAAGAGSTLTVFALIASAADPELSPSAGLAVEDAYFPWAGALHSLLDSLVDHEEDMALEGRALVGYYATSAQAAVRMRMIAAEALRRAEELPKGSRHAVILAAMASFYLCELQHSPSPYAQLVAPSVLEAIGTFSAPTMLILTARRSLRRVSPVRDVRAMLPGPTTGWRQAPGAIEARVSVRAS